MTLLAHSARPDRCVAEQPYSAHVGSVLADASTNAARAARYSWKFGDLLQAAVTLAAEFHDLGKLDPANQAVLERDRTAGRLPLNHSDAGVANVLSLSAGRVGQVAAAVIYAHHSGLPAFPKETIRPQGHAMRDCSPASEIATVKDRIDSNLVDYRRLHAAALGTGTAFRTVANAPAASPLLLRLALSCLVDADHSDTARNYKDPVARDGPSLHPRLRLALLDSFVRGLGYGKTDERSRNRAEIYSASRESPVTPGMIECDSPVGTGKTTAVMAHLLKAATAKRLRRVFVVLPFTNIINQSVDVYREALVTAIEDLESVVAAHHHRVEFDDSESRLFAYLWHAPIVVTTAVQFFETLASSTPAALRKLHQLPGSAIFIDEAHTALPTHLWPQAWKWLHELVADWGCHIVLGSGSLSRFWTLEEFVTPPASLPALVHQDLRADSLASEMSRVRYRSWEAPLGLDTLATWVAGLPGPRLLIVNTVQSAAAIARHLAGDAQRAGASVEHLSTALCPRDRETILTRVRARLKDPNDADWTLVATSCVEAGVDISFRTGVRERCSLTSLLQMAGRVNRSFEYGVADVWDIQLRHDHLLRPHPAFESSARVLGELFAERDEAGKNRVSPLFCTEALRREIRQLGPRKVVAEIDKAECSADFPKMEELFRVIAADTVTAVVDRELIKRLDSGERIKKDDLMLGSVQVWSNRVQAWGLREFQGWIGRSTRAFSRYPELLAWTLDYDHFLGYMAGVLPLVDAGQTGFFV